MIYPHSKVSVVDNSNILSAKCIRVLRSKKNVARIGDLIIISVVSLKRTANVFLNFKRDQQYNSFKVGQILLSVIVQTKTNSSSVSGYKVSFDLNSVIVLKSMNLELSGSRVFSAIFNSIRLKRFSKLISLTNVTK